MKIYTLVGKSGTGKSYKALEVAYEKNIHHIIDDGLFIKSNKIIAGLSAKQASTTVEAVKRAIFNDEKHRKSVLNAIKKENVKSILIMGTSKKMVNKIINSLELIGETIYIDIKDISTDLDIELARKSRKEGKHVIPVPSMQIKKMSSGLSIKPLMRVFKKNNEEKTRVIEKTIIRPTFSYIGKFYISQNVIKDIVVHNIKKEHRIDKINKINIENLSDGINIDINVNINDLEMIKEISSIQVRIIDDIEKLTSINVKETNIYINKVSKNSFYNKK